MKFRAQFVHSSDQRGDIFGRRELRNAVAEIQHVAGSGPERLKRVLNLAPDRFGRGEQHRGIDISLQGRLSADPPARVSQVDRPIQADAIASGRGDVLEPQIGRASCRERV